LGKDTVVMRAIVIERSPPVNLLRQIQNKRLDIACRLAGRIERRQHEALVARLADGPRVLGRLGRNAWARIPALCSPKLKSRIVLAARIVATPMVIARRGTYCWPKKSLASAAVGKTRTGSCDAGNLCVRADRPTQHPRRVARLIITLRAPLTRSRRWTAFRVVLG
jgi:hypothetical protein